MSNNQEKIDLAELTGCDNWSAVETWFGGMTEAQIKAECDKCWPHEDNSDLAHRLLEACRW